MWQRLMRWLITVLAALASSVLALAMFLTTTDVVMRYFFNNPIKGAYEIIELMMGILSPIAILYCSWRKEHVSVEIIYNLLNHSLRRIVLLFSLMCTLLVFVLLAWQGWHLIGEVIDSNLCTPVLGLPMWPAACAMFISFLLIVGITLHEIYKAAFCEREVVS